MGLLTESNINVEASIGSALFCNMKKYGDRVLQYIVDTDESDTYEEVLTRSIRTALRLKDKGVNRNDIISICSYNHGDSCVALSAAFFLGAIPANFDPNLSHLDIIKLLKIIQPKIIFVSEESLPLIERCLTEVEVKTELIVFGNSKKYSRFSDYLVPHPDEENFKPTPVDNSRDTGLVVFSSGTTGMPKGICLSHYSLLNHIKNNNLFVMKIKSERHVGLAYSTFYWISGLAFFLETVVSGGARVVCSKFDAYQTWRIIEKYKVTCMFLPPNNASEFLNHRPETVDTSSLEVFITGGFAIGRKAIEDLRLVLPNTIVMVMYGLTEAGSAVCKFEPQKEGDIEMLRKKPLSCGKIRPVYLWKVVDPDTEKILGPNQRGELRIKSDYTMNGYYKIDSSPAFDSEGYVKTGDIVYYDEDGCFYVVDRIKEMFKYKMWHVLPAVLEDVLMTHPAIKEAAVVSVPHEVDGEHPMGIVALHDKYKHVTPKEIVAFMDERVSEYQKLRAGVKIVDAIQRTVTGKIRRSDLRKMVLEGKI